MSTFRSFQSKNVHTKLEIRESYEKKITCGFQNVWRKTFQWMELRQHADESSSLSYLKDYVYFIEWMNMSR